MIRRFIKLEDYSLRMNQYELDIYSDQLNRWSYRICNRGFNLSYSNHFRDGKLNVIGSGYIEDGTPLKYRDEDDIEY